MRIAMFAWESLHSVAVGGVAVHVTELAAESVPGILEHRPDAKIVFVGDGYMRASLEQRARDLGVAHAVRFPGAMTASGDLVNLFKSTDVVCVPSRNEPFGLTVLEAWAAGKPVVATNQGGPSELVEHGVNGFLVYDNPQSICWGINTIFGNFAHARWMGERGRVNAAYGFSWDAIAGQTESVYRLGAWWTPLACGSLCAGLRSAGMVADADTS
jgi:glycosyltransferase involved in cell wall biosynthesis